jgi:hypothetical protein
MDQFISTTSRRIINQYDDILRDIEWFYHAKRAKNLLIGVLPVMCSQTQQTAENPSRTPGNGSKPTKNQRKQLISR